MGTKAIWKFGPISGHPVKVMGRPVAVNWQDNGQHGLYVWCEVDPEWANLKEDSDQVEWHWLRFVATGMEFEGRYVGTVFQTDTSGFQYVWHCIEVDQ